jgi:hypothetical protein
MLNKLIKYDLEFKMKVLVVFYSLSVIFAILTRIFLYANTSLVVEIIGKICSGVTISMMFNIVVNNVMRMWARFKQNLYGDESYLTHTLPVTKSTLYASKMASAVISLFISFAVIGLSIFIAYYSKQNLEIVKNLLFQFETAYDVNTFSILLAVFLVLLLEVINALQCGFSGIILGHKHNNGKGGFSVLYGFLMYGASQTFVLFVTFIAGLFDKDIMSVFKEKAVVSVSTIKSIIVIAIIAYILVSVIIYFVNVKLFKKGVNVD